MALLLSDLFNSDGLQACARFLALKSECIHPASQESYIKSVSGGKNNSPEMNVWNCSGSDGMKAADACGRTIRTDL